MREFVFGLQFQAYRKGRDRVIRVKRSCILLVVAMALVSFGADMKAQQAGSIRNICISAAGHY